MNTATKPTDLDPYVLCGLILPKDFSNNNDFQRMGMISNLTQCPNLGVYLV